MEAAPPCAFGLWLIPEWSPCWFDWRVLSREAGTAAGAVLDRPCQASMVPRSMLPCALLSPLQRIEVEANLTDCTYLLAADCAPALSIGVIILTVHSVSWNQYHQQQPGCVL
jgi:hypothetical protein